ncbi:MAG TPA: hypothetical protein VK783_02075 [Bacteroidia bacterium]|jgi:hypothetical protein|nr:hypothetical protein [Bacteroidia bacterium]
MKLNNYLAAIFAIAFVPVMAQSTSSDSTKPSFPHKMRDGFIGGAFVLGNSNKGSEVIYGQSREFIVGGGFGYRFAKWNDIGVDIYYKSTDFFLKQDSSKTLPNNILHNSEKVSFDNFGGKVFDRFYKGKMFLDGGAYLDWVIYTKHISWDNNGVANISSGSSTKTIDRQLKFTTPTNYGLTFRLGSKQGVALYFNYRLSNYFKSTTSYTELPVYTLGIALGAHQ